MYICKRYAASLQKRLFFFFHFARTALRQEKKGSFLILHCVFLFFFFLNLASLIFLCRFTPHDWCAQQKAARTT